MPSHHSDAVIFLKLAALFSWATLQNTFNEHPSSSGLGVRHTTRALARHTTRALARHTTRAQKKPQAAYGDWRLAGQRRFAQLLPQPSHFASANVSIRQHTSAYVRICSRRRPHISCQYWYFCAGKASKLSTFLRRRRISSAYSIRQDASGYVSIRHHTSRSRGGASFRRACQCMSPASKAGQQLEHLFAKEPHFVGYVRICQHTSAYVAPSRGGGAFRRPSSLFF